WAEARAIARRAEALLETGSSESDFAPQVHGLLRQLAEEEADRRLMSSLENIRRLQSEVSAKENRFQLERALPEYRQSFREFGLLPETMAPAEAAALLQQRRQS